jgi:hypothetical protein
LPHDECAIFQDREIVSSDHKSKSSDALAVVRDAMSEVVTVRPPFDPQEFARQSERATLPPPATTSDAPELVSGTMEVFLPVESISVLELIVAREDLEWFDLPPAAHKLLEHVDGTTSFDVVCERAGIVLDEVLDLVEDLMRQGIVTAK